MSADTLPFHLFKAQLELQLRMARLAQENAKQWLEQATLTGPGCLSSTCDEIESLQQAGNWQQLAALSTQSFWRQITQQANQVQNMAQSAFSGQSTHAQALQQALQQWQAHVSQAFGADSTGEPLKNLMGIWASILPASGKAAAAEEEKAEHHAA
ncbi:hypothetical protein [Comamonas composti]|uniref:hypothetical protein n=1 Tax=Comamonas composti TaxID=408558 RepID=UPI0004209C72|nr:hypothetical protein [Comamonas composti]